MITLHSEQPVQDHIDNRQLLCRFCGTPLKHTFVDLGTSPLANSYLTTDELGAMEPFYPLRVFTCANCFLVQLPVAQAAENIFGDYAYFSSYVDALVENARRYSEDVPKRLGFDRSALVVEIASNDGYLLQHFHRQGYRVLGIEPAGNVAAAARKIGIPTLVRFFGLETAKELVQTHGQADLLIGNNVLAHVPELNDFVQGMKVILSPQGVVTMEFPHLMNLMEENQFDTIYHEHYSYFSLLTVEKIFARHGLTIFDVDQVPIHGGSLRIHARHVEDQSRPVEASVAELRDQELADGFADITHYDTFSERAKGVKRKLLSFLLNAKEKGRTIVGYGAPAKGNTLLNYCGVGCDFLDYTVDRSPHKQGRFLPGTHIPIRPPEAIQETKPDYVLILPWNLKDEVMRQMSHVNEWGGQFVVPIPELKVYPCE